MNRRLNKIVYIVAIVVLTIFAIVAVLFAVNSYKKMNGDKKETRDWRELESEALESLETPDDIKNAGSVANVGDINQPDGYGVARQITNIPDMNMPDVEVGIGDINFDAEVETKKSGVIVKGNYSDDEKKSIASGINKAEDGKYECYVKWQSGKSVSQNTYSTLVVACGLILEDELNKNESGRYSVIADVLTPESMEAAGLVACYEVDEWGYMTIAADVTIQDLSNMTEIEEIRTFKLYFDGQYLAIAE